MSNFDFDKEFKRATDLVWWALCVKAAIGLIIIGGIGYVAIHFLQKIW
ncbi:hypothetical protein P4U99_23910 [Brevibacillus agri]|nr:hypothetical protein [Brevibacillus agri]MED1646193.1 hypothetical protein [Brevibacillus agri]MED1654211.1 hypothetical protein [Brevibacillus agri]MED1688033.1 hypothetical protein [Brevibacillus agri]MED1695168.1 hypothetical protein [Brevibacillus agri]MED1700184.1 hypothetical protein [Brevibacillus agri]